MQLCHPGTMPLLFLCKPGSVFDVQILCYHTLVWPNAQIYGVESDQYSQPKHHSCMCSASFCQQHGVETLPMPQNIVKFSVCWSFCHAMCLVCEAGAARFCLHSKAKGLLNVSVKFHWSNLNCLENMTISWEHVNFSSVPWLLWGVYNKRNKHHCSQNRVQNITVDWSFNALMGNK